MAWESVPGNDAGAMNGDGSRKLLLHSTEGSTIEGAIGAYRQHNSWPTFTVDCRKRRVVRHLADTVAARSLRNKAGGVETNRDGTILIQIELVGFAGSPESIGARDDLVWLGTEVVGPLCRRNGVPVASSVRWAPYPASYGENAAQRLSAAQWDAYSGILGHQHAVENSHGDPGAIDIATILSAARGDDMPLDDTDRKFITDAINDATFANARRVVQVIAGGEGNTLLGGQDWQPKVVTLPKLLAAVGAINVGDVDEAALAAALAPLLVAQTRSLSDADLAAVATAVNDEQHRRSAG